MKEYSVKISDIALDEVEAIVDYIALDSVENALNWHAKVKEKILSLDSLPERCPVADENEFFKFEVRCLLIDEYRVLFRIEKQFVEVLHIKHPRMKR